MDRIWPVKKIQLGESIHGIWGNVEALMNSDEVFVQRYTEDDDKSGYIYFNSYDGKKRTLAAILQRHGLDKLVPYVKKGELLLMW
ncbi:MAG: hypothetical protein ABIB93_07660 [Chloroflexota bacterium]